jgi:hypothetical protein
MPQIKFELQLCTQILQHTTEKCVIADCLEVGESADIEVQSDAVSWRIILLLFLLGQGVEDPPFPRVGEGPDMVTRVSSLRFCFITST